MVRGKKLLGDHVCDLAVFPNLTKTLTPFQKATFRDLPAHQRWDALCRQLLKLIQAAPANSFLLKALVDYCSRVNDLELTSEPLHITLFECWLNNFSQLSEADHYAIRAKIAGKSIPRDDYGILFPLSGNKTYSGSHFVTAHLAPDVDTTIASFWGWLDAFAARVATAQHLWNLPGGAPDGQVTDLLTSLFSPHVFTYTARTSGSMSLSAMDLLTQSPIVKVTGNTLTSALDHGADRGAILYVSKDGYFQGDWRGTNFEPVKQLTSLLDGFLRWFENHVHSQLVLLFAKPKLTKAQIRPMLKRLFDSALDQSEPAKALTARQRELLDALFVKILSLPKGLHSTYGDFFKALDKRSLLAVRAFVTTLQELSNSPLFDAQGKLTDDRPKLFRHLHELIVRLDHAVHAIRNTFDRLDVVMQIKHDVLGYQPHYATLHSDVEELRFKMEQRDYLTVVLPSTSQNLYPLGIVAATSLRKDTLGTVSQRDFSNLQEMRMASYLQVISVIDHHKVSLNTDGPPQVLVGDVQSSNVFVAELAFAINDRYSTAGMSEKDIAAQLKVLSKTSPSLSNNRLIQSLMKKQLAALSANGHYIHPDREYAEYLCFLHAIFDDTDLLTKVTKRDVECVVSLLNRMKTLSLQQETELLNLDDIADGSAFAPTAAQRILRNPDVYSIYGKIYAGKEQQVEDNLTAASSGQPNTLFSDTKEQNGCCRVGQIKLFSANISHFQRIETLLMQQWATTASQVVKVHPEVDLHMLMVSTIASADEVYRGHAGDYAHTDALWLWVAPTQVALDHLASFLSGFPGRDLALSVAFRGADAGKLQDLFARNFVSLPSTTISKPKEPSLAIISFPAGAINSRKAMISPYLPHLVS